MAFGIYFYSQWNINATFLLLISVVFNYTLARYLTSLSEEKKKVVFVFAISTNILYLGVFKYFIFLWDLFSDLRIGFGFAELLWKPEILLPIGISFYTFHNISYLIEVYDERILPCKNFFTFAIYDLFFPLLLLGPIERPGNLIPQIESEQTITREKIWNGISLLIWGVFIKSTIADPLSRYVEIHAPSFISLEQGILWIVAPVIAFQVYADFFGYSLCAMGLAEMMGFQLMNNFKRPFFASNPSLFWSKWHISLSTWLRDYVYIKLGGNRHGFLRENLNLMIVWFLAGIWHGAGYGFVIWGVYLGLCLVFYRCLKYYGIVKETNLIQAFLGVFFTFYSFSLGLLLFRIQSPGETMLILENLSHLPKVSSIPLMILITILPLFLFDLWQEWKDTDRPNFYITSKPFSFLFLFFLFFLWFSLFSPFGKQDFFYFQF
ncbi:MBOAT family protein [Leptospira sp. 2 VSF19]|uniref:MBOAT family protein n=1 Tax=Leptospira soteropolitanensis TaxID=2950025 RepID=A0AAW5VNS6_9LEPT|nr:MBOAT family O-acyltransferase [Leptospira soteropolitanensis]MCW7494215.1 MBOAT family protein [Leptospira soteropolitanensis]MCW7501810.1 MBOAT family protein [Leptospira soteropolitanensis]MCW7524061.1 MBOAT family protein [Leptospira soteropolitanensis]MCW7527926.1 MBOAT family protein [Leptospira soteropolitanensis]MCW7531780.1 MBOAT family protein [Leptospira soteropolitanensis]